MKKTFDSYQRLAKGMFGMSSLWMGEDHLVYVKGSGFILNFTEEYRRFRYQDIQYFAVSRTNRVIGIILYLFGFLGFAGAIAAILAGRDPGAVSAFLIVSLSILAAGALLFLTLLMRHIWLGPTCYCDLKTNLKRERITPLNRFYLANQTIDLLGDVINEKQNHLVGESTGGSSKSVLNRDQERLSIGKTVLPAFAIYSLFGLIGLAALHLDMVVFCVVALGLIFVGNLMMFRGLVRSYRMATPDPIRRLLFVLLTSVMIFGGVALVYFVHIMATQPVFLDSIMGPFEAFAGILTLGGLTYYLIFLTATLFVFGTSLTGLIQTLKWKKKLNPDAD